MRSKIIAGAMGVAVLSALVGAGTAAAQTVPGVVGMGEQDAVSAFEQAAVPYSVISRAGSASPRQCTVTEQRDLGYRTETDYVWDGDSFERTETQVWKGVGIVLVCS